MFYSSYKSYLIRIRLYLGEDTHGLYKIGRKKKSSDKNKNWIK